MSKRSAHNASADDALWGSHKVARGSTDVQARKKRSKLQRDRLDKMTPQERQRMEAYMHGGSSRSDVSQGRLRALREDDRRMKTDDLSPVARQTLELPEHLREVERRGQDQAEHQQ